MRTGTAEIPFVWILPPRKPTAGRQGRAPRWDRHPRRLRPCLPRTDAEIEREIREDVLERTMWIDTGNVDISVQRGHSALSGRLPTRSDVELLTRLASRVPGVVAVKSTVVWDVDDTARKGRRAVEHPVR